MSEPTIVEFDLDRYLRNSKKVDLGGIEWEEIPDHPLSDGDVMCLHYMMDIETHTVIYLRDLLATRVAADPQITAFLSCWVYEELWHGEAFSDFLRCYGIEVPAEPKLPDGSTPMPTRPNRWRDLRVRVGVGNGLGIVPTMLGSITTRDFAAIHMMWGAVNELTTLTAYHALIRRCAHPVLHQLLRKVIQDERRHFAFYRAQAKARLERSRTARRLVRWALSQPLDTGGSRASRARRRSTRWPSTCSGTGPRVASRSATSTARSRPYPASGAWPSSRATSTRHFAGRLSGPAGPAPHRCARRRAPMANPRPPRTGRRPERARTDPRPTAPALSR